MVKRPYFGVKWHIRLATKTRDGRQPAIEAELSPPIPSHHRRGLRPSWDYVMPQVLKHPEVKKLLEESGPETRLIVQRQFRIVTRRFPNFRAHTWGTHEFKIVSPKLKRVRNPHDMWW